MLAAYSLNVYKLWLPSLLSFCYLYSDEQRSDTASRCGVSASSVKSSEENVLREVTCHRAKGEQERHYKSLDGGHGTQDERSSFEKVQSPTFYVLCLSP